MTNQGFLINDNLVKHKFVFICGLHRSGTSILFRSLRDHPEISGFNHTDSPEDEGMHLQTVFKPSGAYGGAGRFGLNPNAHLTEKSELVTSANCNKLFTEWAPYWDLEKPFLLEKSPPNIIRTRFLQSMFPNVYFIVLTRHPIAVTYATRAWYRHFRIFWRRFDLILKHWVTCHEILREDAQFVKKILVIKYEDFVEDPVHNMRTITDFLEIEPHRIHQEILPEVNKKYFSMWSRDQRTPYLRPFRNRSISKYESRINKFGYSLLDLTFREPFSK